jgi:hypothetical protein
LTGLRISREDVRRLFKGATAMRESDTYQAILEEGGVLTLHRTLLTLGQERFGKPDAAIRQAVEAITDLKRLDRLVKRLLKVSSWQELLATP